MLLGSQAFSQTFGLIITFGGIGLIVNGLIIYIAALVLGERGENRRGAGNGDTAV